MTVTGAQIRERILTRYPELGMMGQTTATGGLNYLTDTIRQKFNRLSTSEYGNAYIRIPVGADDQNDGILVQFERLEPTTGNLYFTPSQANTIDSLVDYELWLHGIFPDSVDRARDRALANRVSGWRIRPLSVLPDVGSWSVSAYSSSAGGETDAAGVATTQDFPNEYQQTSMVITNSGAAGYLSSPSFYVQPQQQYIVFGKVSVRAQTGSLRVRDITNGADIDTSDTDTFTLRGPQYFVLRYTVPAGCQEIQLWAGGASASCVTEWYEVSLLPCRGDMITLPARVRAETDIGNVYWRTTGNQSSETAMRRDLTPIARVVDRYAARLQLSIPSGHHPVYYEERHRYTALQTGYVTVAQRVVGDAATTDADIDFVAAATVVELLEGRAIDEHIQGAYEQAVIDLASWDDQMMRDIIVTEDTRPTGYLMALR